MPAPERWHHLIGHHLVVPPAFCTLHAALHTASRAVVGMHNASVLYFFIFIYCNICPTKKPV